jgi:hypothetical protein
VIGHAVRQILECLQGFKLRRFGTGMDRIKGKEKTPGADGRLSGEKYSFLPKAAVLTKCAEKEKVALSLGPEGYFTGFLLLIEKFGKVFTDDLLIVRFHVRSS